MTECVEEVAERAQLEPTDLMDLTDPTSPSDPTEPTTEEPYIPPARPNRALRRWAARQGAKRRPASVRTAAIRVYFRPSEGVTVEEELLALGALQELFRQHPELQIVYSAGAEEIYPLLPRRWFLDGFLPPLGDRMFAEQVGDEVALTFSIPSPEQVEAAEKERYNQRFEAEKAAKEAQQAGALEKGIKDFKAIMPVYQFLPRWHKGNGLLWHLADELGLPVTVPDAPLTPFGELPGPLYEQCRKALQGAHLVDQPFVLYSFPADANALVLLAAVDPQFEGFRMVSRQEVEKVAGTELSALLAGCAHPNCAYVIGGDRRLSTAAWAADGAPVFEIYQGENPRWDGCQGPQSYTLPWDQLPEEQRALGLGASIAYHLEGD